MQESTKIEKTEATTLSIKEIFFKYLRFLPLFILTMVLSFTAAYLYLRYTDPVFQSSGDLLLRNEGGKSNEKFEQIFQSDGQKNVQSEIELISSRPLMNRVVKALNLNFTYKSVGKVRDNNVYKKSPFYIEVVSMPDSITSYEFDLKFPDNYSFTLNDEPKRISYGQVFRNGRATFRLVKDVGVSTGHYRARWDPTSVVTAQLINNLVVAPKGQQSSIIVISMEAGNPFLAADIVNQLMQEYQDVVVEEKKLSTQRTLEFIDERLIIVEREVDSATNNIVQFKRANNLVDEEAQTSSYFSTLTETDRAINDMRSQLEIAQILEGYLRNQSNAYSLVPSSLGLPDQTLNTLISSYNVTQLRYKELLDGGGSRENVVVKQVEQQIEKLRVNILENLKNIKISLNNQVADLQRKNTASQSQIRALPAKQQRLIDLERQQQTKLGVYNILLEKREESAISRAGTISNIKVIEPAYANAGPVKPNRRNVWLIAFGVGILIPLLVIGVLEMLNDKVTTRTDIEKLTTAPILGEIGHSYSGQNLVVKKNSRGVVSEQFRIIRSNLQFVLNHVEKPVLLITSSFSGEGKSFVSTNLGAVMALAGKRAVILEFDIRKPKILSHLNISKKPGLTNYLLGKATIEELLIPVPEVDNLFVISCGPVPPNPSEILLDKNLDTLFAYLKQNFDVVVMDTAPVGMVSDAMTLSKYADATIYLIRQGHTFKKQVNLIHEFYTENKLPKINLIVNDVKLTGGYGHYGYGRYGYGHSYGYGYGSGYFDDNETPRGGLMQRLFGLNGKATKKKQSV